MMHEIVCEKGHKSLTSHIEQQFCTICTRKIVSVNGENKKEFRPIPARIPELTPINQHRRKFSFLERRIGFYNEKIKYFEDRIKITMMEMEEINKEMDNIIKKL